MAQPSFFGDGHNQRRSDPKRIVWCKKLGEFQDSITTPLPANNPMPNDTIRVLMQKLLCAFNGVPYTG
jgi:hypothetical protein